MQLRKVGIQSKTLRLYEYRRQQFFKCCDMMDWDMPASVEHFDFQLSEYINFYGKTITPRVGLQMSFLPQNVFCRRLAEAFTRQNFSFEIGDAQSHARVRCH